MSALDQSTKKNSNVRQSKRLKDKDVLSLNNNYFIISSNLTTELFNNVIYLFSNLKNLIDSNV